ncbi:hypothetical protein GVX86_01645 [[Haemophilus] felis]|nr:hypothetical protein [[Haemophilus] felis]
MKPEIKIPLDYEVYPEKRNSRTRALSRKDCLKIIAFLAAVALTLVLLVQCRPAYAQTYIEHYLAQGFTPAEIAEMERQANAEWKQTYGDIPPNLTEEQSQYLEKATALLQGGKH